MKRLRRLFRDRPRDDGSALVLALIVILVVGITVGALLSFAGSGLAIAPKERALRNQTNYISGAVDGAINRIRNTSFEGVNDPAFPCPDFTPPAPLEASAPGAGTGVSYKVTCSPKGTSGVGGADQPRFAILALGTSPGEGINQKKTPGNHLLTIDGPIFSHNQLTVEAGGGNDHNVMHVKGSAYAMADPHTNCNDKLVTTLDNNGLPHCSFIDTNSIGKDPEYSAAVPNQAALDTLISTSGADPAPDCPNSPDVVEFQPGYYSVLPSALVPSTCSGTPGNPDPIIYHFNPGEYVFNFPTPGKWDLSTPNPVNVIGGTANGNWPTTGATPAAGEGCDEAQPGVQFEFVGASHLSVGSQGSIELCAPTQGQAFPGSPQRISVVGFQTSSTNTAGGSTATALEHLQASTAPTPGGSPSWTNAAGAQTIDTVSQATASPDKTQTATMAYSSFDNAPKGSAFGKLYVRVAETISDIKDKLQVVTHSTGPGGQTFDIGGLSPAGTCDTLPAHCVDITSVLRTPSWRDLNSLSLTYTATGTKSTPGLVSLDGIELVATSYVTPSLTDITCTPDSGCTFFDSSVNLNVFIKGSVYAPTGGFSVEVSSASGTIFHRGIVVETIDIHLSASSQQDGSPFRLPPSSPGSRVVLLTGSVDNSDGTGYHPLVEACVAFLDSIDTPEGPAAYPGYKVEVKHWDVQSPQANVPSCS